MPVAKSVGIVKLPKHIILPPVLAGSSPGMFKRKSLQSCAKAAID